MLAALRAVSAASWTGFVVFLNMMPYIGVRDDLGQLILATVHRYSLITTHWLTKNWPKVRSWVKYKRKCSGWWDGWWIKTSSRHITYSCIKMCAWPHHKSQKTLVSSYTHLLLMPTITHTASILACTHIRGPVFSRLQKRTIVCPCTRKEHRCNYNISFLKNISTFLVTCFKWYCCHLCSTCCTHVTKSYCLTCHNPVIRYM